MKLAKDSSWLLTARVGAQALAVVFTLLLARRLGLAAFGLYAVMAAVLLIGNMLTTFGTDMVIIRETAAGSGFSILSSALAIQFGASILFIASVWIAAPLLMTREADAVIAMRVYILSLIPLAFYTVFTSVLRGRQFVEAYAWLNLSGAALKPAFAWIFIPPGAGVLRLAFLLFLVQILIALIGAFLCTVKVDGFWRDWKFKPENIRRILRISSPLALLTLLAMLQQKLGVLALSILGGPVMAGSFSAAARTVEAAETGHVAVFTAVFPEMSRPSKSGRFRLVFLLLMVGAVFGAMFLSVFALPIMNILFGRGYEASVPALRILAWMMVPFTVNTYLTLKYVALKIEAPLLRASSSSLAVLILASLWLIPSSGVVGACFAALIAEATQSALLISQWRSAWFSPIIPASKA